MMRRAQNLKINRNLNGVWVARLKEMAKGTSVVAKRLTLVLPVAIVVLGAGSLGSVYAQERGISELKIKRVNKLGKGQKRIEMPGESDSWYVIGSSNEKVFTVKIKNNTKEEKRNVKVKLFLYDKEGKPMGEKSPSSLRRVYADKGYLIDEGILYPHKSVKLYFAVSKSVKYVKAELSYNEKLVDVKTQPPSFLERLK